MNVKKLFGICVGIFMIVIGCENVKHPTSSNLLDGKSRQAIPTRPSEDTAGSEIALGQYPEDYTVIVAIGDSITYGVRSPIGGYPAILQSKLTQAGYNNAVVIKI